MAEESELKIVRGLKTNEIRNLANAITADLHYNFTVPPNVRTVVGESIQKYLIENNLVIDQQCDCPDTRYNSVPCQMGCENTNFV